MQQLCLENKGFSRVQGSLFSLFRAYSAKLFLLFCVDFLSASLREKQSVSSHPAFKTAPLSTPHPPGGRIINLGTPSALMPYFFLTSGRFSPAEAQLTLAHEKGEK